MPGHLGFTGTRNGLDRRQSISLSNALARFRHEGYEWFHHGDCIGADESAHYRAKNEGFRTHVHPPSNDTYRAHCRGDKEDTPLSFRTRNQIIVDMSAILIACPKSIAFREAKRGGTYMTYNMAVDKGIPILIIFPDGTTEWVNREH